MPLQVLQRPNWGGAPVDLGEFWRLAKSDDCRRRPAVCRLFTHQLGWELNLEVNSEFALNRVLRAQDDPACSSARDPTPELGLPCLLSMFR